MPSFLRIGVFTFVWFLVNEVAYGADRFYMGAVGDSITRGFNSGGILAHPENSWAVGRGHHEDFISHRQRLTDLGYKVVVRDASLSGAKSGNLKRQVRKLRKMKRLDYVTFLMGANDVCSWSADHASQLALYESRIREAVDSLIEHSPDVKILMLAIPDMMNLWALGVNSNCQKKWNMIGFCKNLLAESVTDLERKYFGERLSDANHALRRVSSDYPENIRLVQSTGEIQFELAHVSPIDCFHPSVSGQGLLSEESWQEGWFAD